MTLHGLFSALFSAARRGALGVAMGCLLSATGLQAQTVAPAVQSPVPALKLDGESAIKAWLQRVNDAPKQRAYTGTFVVSSGSSLSSARIWHICDGKQQMERIETLSGVARSTFRRDDQVITFFPQEKVAVAERRESLKFFPNLLQSAEAAIAEHYQLKWVGHERVVGMDTDVVLLIPADSLRFGYRLWTDRKSGLLVRLQTLDADGRVLEQSAFSEIQMDAPVSMSKLTTLMAQTDGYQVLHPEVQKVNAQEMGWNLRKEVPGFKPVGCFSRAPSAQSAPAPGTLPLQWMFSDGLANVSLFIETFDPKRHLREGWADGGGATRSVTRKVGDWWLTVVGEVPLSTLNSFALALERKK